MAYNKRTLRLTGSAASAAVLVGPQYAADFSSFSVQITGAAAATTAVVVEVSNDNTNWVATRMQNVADATAIQGAVAADVVGPIWRGQIVARYLRVRCSTYAAAGTVAVDVLLSPDIFTSVVKST